ncbi:MAG: SDR family NAD(P)-dependent oxidoreductase [Planctomycetota bacterium]|jgi:meso-butanediol dehydrogenase / (S,S)-butanediol dehydrogenase / diacetyl reductase|nr:SDR family NAD(P)-dependent oxidoreductase [Planctomycetota bacterium]
MSAEALASTGKVAVITGAGSGVGRATAILLAEEGWRCALLGRTETKLASTAAAFAVSAPSPLLIECDLGRSEEMPVVIRRIIEHFGRIDAILNIAGIAPQVPIAETNASLMRSTLDQNLVGPTILVAAAWPELVQRRGVVVNVSSMSSIDPFHHFTAYAASKSGLDSLTRSIMAEAADTGVRAFTLNPGAIETPLLRRLVDEETFPTELALTPHAVAEEILGCIEGSRDHRIGQPFPMLVDHDQPE